jgi:hypothetical protein
MLVSSPSSVMVLALFSNELLALPVVPAVCSRLMTERPLGVELAELPAPSPPAPSGAPLVPDPPASSLLLVVSAMDPCFLRRLFAAMDLGRNLSRPLASIMDDGSGCCPEKINKV